MTTEPKAVRTSAQALQQQKEDTERDYKAKVAAQKEAARAIIAATSTAVAVPDTRTTVQRYLDEIAPSTFPGREGRFDPKGNKYVFRDDGSDMPPDADYAAECDQTLIGYIKFNGEGVPPDSIMGLLYQGFVLPDRRSLGDLDESQWQLGLDGQPADPWVHRMCLVLRNLATNEYVTFITQSKTGRRAVGSLLKHYDRMQRTDPEAYPVVRLKSGGYMHRDSRVGFVPTPAFAVVGKTPKASAAIPDTSPSGDLDDSIPF